MKEVDSIFITSFYGLDEGKLEPRPEVCLALKEASYAFDAKGESERLDEITYVRFHASPQALRLLADRLANAARREEMRLSKLKATKDGLLLDEKVDA